MKIHIALTSVLVEDQSHALTFYTEVLGFTKKQDIALGDARWLTVVSSDAPDAVELVLEPTSFEPAKAYQRELFDAGIPATAFRVDDIEEAYTHLTEHGVVFSQAPTAAGPVTQAVFDDTCGNRIQLYQV